MRVVLDTNVVVSALLWGGLPYRLLEMATMGAIQLYVSPVLLDELREVLARPHLAARFVGHRGSAAEALVLYAELATCVRPTSVPAVVPDDPDDDHVIACARSAGATLIVTGDSDLLRLVQHDHVRIVTAAHALQILGDSPED